LSLNPETLTIEPRPVSAFVKREAPPELIRVQTRSGREIVATPYHPLFTLREGRLQPLRADEVKPGIRIAVPKRLPVAEKTVELRFADVLEQFRLEDRIFVPSSERLREWAYGQRKRFSSALGWAQAANVPDSQFRGLLQGQ